MYVPTVARFTARDPLPENGEPVVFGPLPPYLYAHNVPTVAIDPSGLEPVLFKCFNKCNGCFPGSSKGPPVKDKYCSTFSWLIGKCCTQKQLDVAKECCKCKDQELSSCQFTIQGERLGTAFSFECKAKKKRWKGSCNARGTCPKDCGVFPAEGDSKDECERAAFQACVVAGCNTPGGTPFNCQCSHAHCFSTD